MKWFRKTPPTADISMLRVELMKSEMKVIELRNLWLEAKEENEILKGRILQFIDEVELLPEEDGSYCMMMHSCDIWDALEILRGDR